MSKEHIVRYKKGMKSRTDWARVDAMTDDDIDYSDCHELDEEFWANAKLVVPGEVKVALGVRFDRDVVEWFRQQGYGYQSKMNAVLKTYVQAQKSFAANKQKTKKRAS